MLDRWQRQQCQLISTACRLRGGADVIGVQWAQTSAANCWPLRAQGKGKGERAWETGHVRAGAVAFFSLSRPSEGSSIARGGTMRRGEDVGGEVLMTRGRSVLHVACWSQGLLSEMPLAVAVAATAAEGRLAHCTMPSAAFLSRGQRGQAMRCRCAARGRSSKSGRECAGRDGGRPADGAQLAEDDQTRRDGTARRWQTEGWLGNYETGTARVSA